MADTNSSTFDFETKLWILLPIYDGDDFDANPPPEFAIVYDCYHGFVIEATTEGEARRIASDTEHPASSCLIFMQGERDE